MQVPLTRQVSNFLAIVLPFAAFGLAIALVWGGAIQWIDLTVLAVGYVDFGGLFIRLLESVGLAWQVVRVSPERQRRYAAGAQPGV